MENYEKVFDAMKQLGLPIPPMSTKEEQEKLHEFCKTIAEKLKTPVSEWFSDEKKKINEFQKPLKEYLIQISEKFFNTPETDTVLKNNSLV